MTRPRPRSKLAALTLSAAALGALAIWLPLAASAADAKGGRDTLVPVGAHSSGFGEFTDGRANKMRRIFGRPDNADRDQFVCTLRWRSLGIRAEFALFGTASGNPCRKGTFIEARLTDRRWHTKSKLRPGSPSADARQESLRRCTKNSCGVNGFALELHRIDCAAGRVPGVIARVAGGEVTALVVRWRGCE